MHILALLETASDATLAASGLLEARPSAFQAPVAGSRFTSKKLRQREMSRSWITNGLLASFRSLSSSPGRALSYANGLPPRKDPSAHSPARDPAEGHCGRCWRVEPQSAKHSEDLRSARSAGFSPIVPVHCGRRTLTGGRTGSPRRRLCRRSSRSYARLSCLSTALP
jgi:hypothetical protein